MIVLLVKLFVVGFFLNILWELLHSCLYKTCLEGSHIQNVKRLSTMALRDAIWIVVFYAATSLIFQDWDIFANMWRVLTFVIFTMVFAFIDETWSIRHHRWEYSKNMPTIFGVGVTPLVELGVTGVIALLIVAYPFVG